MADDIRIKDLQSTASYMESDDYLPIDGLALGNRKIPFTGLMDSEDGRLPTTDKTLRGAITEHEGDISEIKQSLSQLHAKAYTVTKIEGTLTTTETTYNNIQVGGEYRKFSDYDYLLFLLKYTNSDIRDTVLMPTAYWASGSQVARQILHGAGGTTAANYNVSGIISKYNNDTSIKANTTGNNTFKFLEIIGLKIQTN